MSQRGYIWFQVVLPSFLSFVSLIMAGVLVYGICNPKWWVGLEAGWYTPIGMFIWVIVYMLVSALVSASSFTSLRSLRYKNPEVTYYFVRFGEEFTMLPTLLMILVSTLLVAVSERSHSLVEGRDFDTDSIILEAKIESLGLKSEQGAVGKGNSIASYSFANPNGGHVIEMVDRATDNPNFKYMNNKHVGDKIWIQYLALPTFPPHYAERYATRVIPDGYANMSVVRKVIAFSRNDSFFTIQFTLIGAYFVLVLLQLLRLFRLGRNYFLAEYLFKKGKKADGVIRKVLSGGIGRYGKQTLYYTYESEYGEHKGRFAYTGCFNPRHEKEYYPFDKIKVYYDPDKPEISLPVIVW